MICAGCGACSSACPSGAISYDAPPVDFTMRRVQTLARAYLEAGGEAPRTGEHLAAANHATSHDATGKYVKDRKGSWVRKRSSFEEVSPTS